MRTYYRAECPDGNCGWRSEPFMHEELARVLEDAHRCEPAPQTRWEPDLLKAAFAEGLGL